MNNKPTLLDLLANGKAEIARAKAARAIRHSAPSGIDINALARQIEAELLWRSVSLVTIFNEQECLACGQKNIALQGIMVEQHHTRDRGARRLLRSVENHPQLPRRSECWAEHTDCCSQCYTNESPLPEIVPLPLPERKEEVTAKADLTKPLSAATRPQEVQS